MWTELWYKIIKIYTTSLISFSSVELESCDKSDLEIKISDKKFKTWKNYRKLVGEKSSAKAFAHKSHGDKLLRQNKAIIGIKKFNWASW